MLFIDAKDGNSDESIFKKTVNPFCPSSWKFNHFATAVLAMLLIFFYLITFVCANTSRLNLDCDSTDPSDELLTAP